MVPDHAHFKGVNGMKRLFEVLIGFVVPIYIGYATYQVYLAFTIGEFDVPFCKRNCGVVSQTESPIEFWFSLITSGMITTVYLVLLIVTIIGLVFIGTIYIREKIEQKVKAYGGNYNVNTFKAILRGIWKGH